MAQTMVVLLGWCCKACRFESQSANVKLQEEIADLTHRIASMQSQLDEQLAKSIAAADRPTPCAASSDSSNSAGNPEDPAGKIKEQEAPMLYADVLKVVSKTVRDADRRRRNVIISGLAENDTALQDAETML